MIESYFEIIKELNFLSQKFNTDIRLILTDDSSYLLEYKKTNSALLEQIKPLQEIIHNMQTTFYISTELIFENGQTTSSVDKYVIENLKVYQEYRKINDFTSKKPQEKKCKI